MSDLLLFAQNLLDDANVLYSDPVTTLLDRLRDRDRGAQWSGLNTGVHDISIDLGVATPASAIALINHNIAVSVEVAGSSTGTFGAAFATGTVNADPFLLTFATQTWRYFNLRITSGAVIPVLGEYLLGVPRTVTLPPFLSSSGTGTLGNTHGDTSPAGYRWAVKRGVPRVRLPYSWTAMTDAELAAVQGAFSESDEGAKNLLVRDELGTLRWMSIVTPALAPVPLGLGQNELPEFALEEAI